jgi:hypothetical protein
MSDSDSDLLDRLLQRLQEKTSDRLDRQMRDADEIKTLEQESSQRRLDEMWTLERARQQAISEAQAKQRQHERTIVRWVLVTAAVLIAIVAGFVVLLSL